ncbi:DEAD/DEAH box helicase family protein [Bacillus sp. SB49]|uniref:DEAD/DEAH box helicase family protein n=1 Tax=Bacillus sp. SB49 TaxID=1071080 RepID=UPI0004794B6F|nr:DEAD/DEAH box helicase family protein [Bacillus sp. SB49]QHT48504.1 DEAD/DEAH box helicase family protein [Bacillus sp. SB49]
MTFHLPEYIQLRDYQKKAIRNWRQNKGTGLLEMATGTGKTITALALASDLFQDMKRLNIIIVTPFTQLSSQWMDECRNFGLKPIKGYQASKLWQAQLDDAIRAYKKGYTDLVVTVTTNATFSMPSFQEKLNKMDENTLLIVDEAHYFGANKLNRSLPQHVKYRLALTATPTRWRDIEGTDNLLSYFGNEVVFSFSLKEAIEMGFLTKYYYYPRLVHLNDRETEEYVELTKKIKKLYFRSKEDSSAKESMEKLSLRRARIIQSAENKLYELIRLLKETGVNSHSLFYCGDGEFEGERQVDVVVKILREHFELKASRFTSRETNLERDDLLSNFEAGSTQALVAIKCLDEGIDVPATKYAYLIASSGNPKEFVQRRGRVLRKHSGKKAATIYDFIVVPPDLAEISDASDDYHNMVRSQLKKEFLRFKEFSSLAINGPEAEDVIWELKKEFNLMDI